MKYAIGICVAIVIIVLLFWKPKGKSKSTTDTGETFPASGLNPPLTTFNQSTDFVASIIQAPVGVVISMMNGQSGTATNPNPFYTGGFTGADSPQYVTTYN